MTRRFWILTCIAVAVSVSSALADAPKFVDDDELTNQFNDKLTELAKAGKCLKATKVQRQVDEENTGNFKPTASDGKPLSPEEIYRKALPSVFVIGTVLKDAESKTGYSPGRMATAWVLAAEGILVTNWHVFDKIDDDEFYGVMDREGNTYPLTAVLASNKNTDVAIIKVDAKGLTPLAVASESPGVASWVSVLGHPGDRHFMFTQGTISRFNKFNDPETKKASKWMSITAEYAFGSSGSPVLNKAGAVVGMATLTESIDYPEDDAPVGMPAARNRMIRKYYAQKPKDDKPKEPKPKDDKPRVEGEGVKGSSLQMVIKLSVPLTELRAVIAGKE